MNIRILLLLTLLLASGILWPANVVWAQQNEAGSEQIFEPPPVYEASLLRLAEILGGLYFLRGLCGHGDADVWKQDMEAILAAEEPGPQRRSRLIARFNQVQRDR